MSGADHVAQVTSGDRRLSPVVSQRREPLASANLVKTVWNWQCSCGALGRGMFASRAAAERDHDEHMLAALEPEL